MKDYSDYSRSEIIDEIGPGCTWKSIMDNWGEYTDNGIADELDEMFPEADDNYELAERIFELITIDRMGEED